MGIGTQKNKKKKWITPKSIEFLIKTKTLSGGVRGSEGQSGKGHKKGS